MPAWRDQVETARMPLRWEIHAPRVPIARLAELMTPFSSLINEQPLGELEMPPIRYELAGFESWYRELDARGGEHYLILLNAGDEVAAVCDANWDARAPERVHQSFTAVAAPWRGQGVAKAVKAAMLLLVRERRPEVTTFTTYNAQSNAPMLSINQRLGFRLHREECTYQIGRDNHFFHRSVRLFRTGPCRPWRRTACPMPQRATSARSRSCPPRPSSERGCRLWAAQQTGVPWVPPRLSRLIPSAGRPRTCW